MQFFKSAQTAAQIDPDTGLLSAPAFHRECRQCAAASSDGSYRWGIAIRPDLGPFRRQQFSKLARMRLLGKMRHRLRGTLPLARICGHYRMKTLLVPLTLGEVIELEQTFFHVRESLTATPILLSTGEELSMRVTIDLLDLAGHSAIGWAIANPRHRSPSRALVPTRSRGLKETLQNRNQKALQTETAGLDRLFRTADLLMPAQTSRTGR